MDERSLFDSMDDDRGVAAEGTREGLATHPRPGVGHAIASSIESRGGADAAPLSLPTATLNTPDELGSTSTMDRRDDASGGIEPLASSILGPTDSLWRECSLETFMAMTEQEQLDYCARRDEDSARFADEAEDAKFYLDRAAWYRARLSAL